LPQDHLRGIAGQQAGDKNTTAETISKVRMPAPARRAIRNNMYRFIGVLL
jgi:hypothetical protein